MHGGEACNFLSLQHGAASVLSWPPQTRTHRLGCVWYPNDCGLAGLYSGKCRTSVLLTGSWSLAAAAVSGQGGPCAGFSLTIMTYPSSNRYLPRRSAQSLTHHNLTPPASQCCGHFCIDISATASLLYPHDCKQAVRKQHHLLSALPSCGSATHPIHNSARSSKHRRSSQSFAHHWRRHLGHQRAHPEALSARQAPAHQLSLSPSYTPTTLLGWSLVAHAPGTASLQLSACCVLVTTAPPTTARPLRHASPRPSSDLIFCRRYQQ
jgi:hypothetical protein